MMLSLSTLDPTWYSAADSRHGSSGRKDVWSYEFEFFPPQTMRHSNTSQGLVCEGVSATILPLCLLIWEKGRETWWGSLPTLHFGKSA